MDCIATMGHPVLLATDKPERAEGDVGEVESGTGLLTFDSTVPRPRDKIHSKMGEGWAIRGGRSHHSPR